MEEPDRLEEGSPDPDDPIVRSEEALGQPTGQDVADSISRQLLDIHERSYGRGAGNVNSHLVGDTLIVVLDDLELLPNEEYLISNGKKQAVHDLRTRFQQAIEGTFRAAVERATGRRVVAFTSNTHLEEPFFAVEIFRLEPQG
jgi:uncharacterized protein YbcI